MLLQVSVDTFAMGLATRQSIKLKSKGMQDSHRSIPLLPTAYIDGSLLSVDLIRCDDEDKNNKNWIQRYNLGYTLDSGFNESIALGDFGITANGNTTYSVSLSTDAKFSKNNRFYPSRLY